MSSEFVTVPGIRVVRLLARDPHVERLLVQVDGDDGPAPAEVIRAVDAAGAERMRRLVAALDRWDAGGDVGLRDVIADAHAPAVLVAHRRGTRLSELLVLRDRWRAGEVVSLLTPVAAAVAGMHDAGVAHGALGAARIIVDADGVGVDDLDRAELFAPGAPEVVREGVDAVARDRQYLRELAAELLDRIDGSRATAAEQLLSRVRSAPAARIIPDLLEGLAQLAAATPVCVESGADVDAVASHPAAVVSNDPEPRVDRSGPVGRMLGELGGTAASAAVVETIARVRALVDRTPANRRRVLIGGGVAVALAGMLLALIPPSDRRPSDRRPSDGGPSAASGSTSATEPRASTTPAGGSDVADDPAVAVATLLARREACFRELSLLCLDGVDQPGSAALDADRRALLAMRDGGEGVAASVEVVDVRVVERHGDSALVELGPETAPASLLLMRSEAGWRIRDWVAGG